MATSTRFEIIRAFAVHIFTACGAALALLALIFATGGHWAAMFFCLGMALVVGLAMHGPFVGWQDSLIAFALSLAWALALYPLRQVLLARIILRVTPAELDRTIAQRHDPWLGAAEGLFYVLAALCLAAGW